MSIYDQFITFLNTGRYAFLTIFLSLTRGRRCSGLTRYAILYSHHSPQCDNATALEEFAISECSCCLRVVAISNKSEDRLVKRLLNSSKHNLLNTPVADVGEVLHVELGLVLKNIIQVVR